MAVCILGMHRSGTSMVTRLLHTCGLDLGAQASLYNPDNADKFDADIQDNPEGYWENLDFIQLNDEILSLFQGDFYQPPTFPTNWENDERLAPISNRARQLIQQFPDDRLWGWKDPRNTLTLPFWKKLLPDLKIVLCMRNPHEVADSITARGWNTTESALEWWQQYHNILTPALNDDTYLVTHYVSYFYDPEGELRRVCEFIGLEPGEAEFAAAVTTIRRDLRRNAHLESLIAHANLPTNVYELYQRLITEAGAVYQAMLDDAAYQQQVYQDVLIRLYQSPQSIPQVRRVIDELTRELSHKDLQIQNQAEQLQKLHTDHIALAAEHQTIRSDYEDIRYKYSGIGIRLPTIASIKALPRTIYWRLVPYETRRRLWLNRNTDVSSSHFE